jgi:hypothetical protein
MVKKISSKIIIKEKKASIVIRNNKPAKYAPVYFQAELNTTKNNLYFD